MIEVVVVVEIAAEVEIVVDIEVEIEVVVKDIIANLNHKFFFVIFYLFIVQF